MNSNRLPAPLRARVWASVAFALLTLGGASALASRGLAVESGQAHAYVTQGQEALAKGDRAVAVLSFERARLLAPRADFVRSALAENAVRPVGTPVAQAAGWVSPREWSCLAVFSAWLTGLGFAVAVGLRGGRQEGNVEKACRAASRVALVSSVAFVLAMGGVVESAATSRALAVVSTSTGALISPYESAGATADVPAGEVVLVGKRYGGFFEVRGAEGERGWVHAGALRSVVGAGA